MSGFGGTDAFLMSVLKIRNSEPLNPKFLRILRVYILALGVFLKRIRIARTLLNRRCVISVIY